jgi:deoxyribodipyrimidine photolyase
VSAALACRGIEAVSFGGHVLYEPSRVNMDEGYSGGHWGTLMPFLRACERSGPSPPLPLPPPSRLDVPEHWPMSVPLSSLELAPAAVKKCGGRGQRWAKKITSHWHISEAAALEMMRLFVGGQGLARYEFDRSCADRQGAVSSLSPYVPIMPKPVTTVNQLGDGFFSYLRFGQLSVRQLYHAIRSAGLERDLTKTFSRRLHWRDLA